MMKILLLTKYDTLGASSRIRFYQYLPDLHQAGMEITVSPLFNNCYLSTLYQKKQKSISIALCSYLRRIFCLCKASSYDLLWIEKELFPWLPAWAENLLHRFGIPYVADYDDAIFHQYDLHPNRLVRQILGKKIDAVMKHAVLVTVGNEYLAEKARAANAKHVEFLPTVIDLKRYAVVDKNRSGIFTIGWIGSPQTVQYLAIIKEALQEVCDRHQVRLLMIGSGEVDHMGIPHGVREWVEKREVADIQCFDVGIMPLADEPWERGKCGYKLIQCMACGLPVIASPVGINKVIVDDGINGFLAKNSAEWVMAFEKLILDPKLRETMGALGRIKVEKQYTMQGTVQRLIGLLQSAGKK